MTKRVKRPSDRAPAPYPQRGHQFTIKGEREIDRPLACEYYSPRGEREQSERTKRRDLRAESFGARRDDRFMPTRIGSSGPR